MTSLIGLNRIKDVVVALVLLVEARVGKNGSDKKEETEEPDDPHGEPLTTGSTRWT